MSGSLLAIFICCLLVVYVESSIPCVDEDGKTVAVGKTWTRCDGLCCMQTCKCKRSGGSCGPTMCNLIRLPEGCRVADGPKGSDCCPVICPK